MDVKRVIHDIDVSLLLQLVRWI